MLSKEEYTTGNLREHCIKTMQFSNKDSNAYKEHGLTLSIIDENISLKYKLDKLESDKQKLIEKLEEDKHKIESTYSQINGNYFMAQDKLDYIKEILKILKGEKE